MTDLRDFFDQLIFQDGVRRYTQQSPVMPDVWYHYGLTPDQPQDLLLIPNWRSNPAELAEQLKHRLANDPKKTRERTEAKIAYNQSTVAASLTFEEIVRNALPLSGWWRKYLRRLRRSDIGDGAIESSFDPLSILHENAELQKEFRKKLIEAFDQPSEPNQPENPDHSGQIRELRLTVLADEKEGEIYFTGEMIWLAQIVGSIAYLSKQIPETFSGANAKEVYADQLGQSKKDLETDLMPWMAKLIPGPENHDYPSEAIADGLLEVFESTPANNEPQCSLFIINRNRETLGSISESTSAIKADAAQRLFDVGGKGISWAVLDSGIDAKHIAFRHRSGKGVPDSVPFKRISDRVVKNQTRIKGTYDFVHIRELLSIEIEGGGTKTSQKKAIEDQLGKVGEGSLLKRLKEMEMLETLWKALVVQRGHSINWDLFAPVIQIPHDEKYRVPVHPHGTHVAGIIGADWREGDTDGEDEEDVEPPFVDEGNGRVTGVCPEINLYDLRVLDGQGRGDEFSIMAALQFVRYLNDRHDYVEVHGVNLSFSIEHDVSNYACGRTPVCVECEQLVGNGIVVVAAAGNSGRARYLKPDGFAEDGFRTVSITDPGNAQGVITVGSTHRIEPHTYGVSYFSSRGPTGDGRLKPDLVAPGEKICSTVPGNRDLYLDGTSMAAPHVSGAAALLMDRNYEFIKRPDRIKEVLCQSATDLGREPYFQGAGLLDILRALQSV